MTIDSSKNWIDLAKDDFDTGMYLFDGARYPHAIYTLCQAVEKLLKASQIKLRRETPKKIHNLVSLGKSSGLDVDDNQYDLLEVLNTHYGRIRYRDLSQTHYNTKKKVEPIVKKLEKTYLWILKELKNH